MGLWQISFSLHIRKNSGSGELVRMPQCAIAKPLCWGELAVLHMMVDSSYWLKEIGDLGDNWVCEELQKTMKDIRPGRLASQTAVFPEISAHSDDFELFRTTP